ncbi:hypothetical protein BT69DRAFT_1278706 [Atractiella rhizophila]|nr:hypothetical protein BT69DRAFT_1278706 [Atractiella rhizophila]
MTGHGFIRLWTERYRADFRGGAEGGNSSTAKMAWVQIILSCTLSLSILAMTSDPRPSIEAQLKVPDLTLQNSSAVIYAIFLGAIVYGVNVGEIGSWVSLQRAEGSFDTKRPFLPSPDRVHRHFE